jgi:hypothetical protein
MHGWLKELKIIVRSITSCTEGNKSSFGYLSGAKNHTASTMRETKAAMDVMSVVNYHVLVAPRVCVRDPLVH